MTIVSRFTSHHSDIMAITFPTRNIHGGSLPRVIKKRNWYFILTGCLFVILSLSYIIMLPILIDTKPFFHVYNKSNYVEIANLFLRVDVYLRGHCVILLDNSQACHLLPPYQIFYKMPDWSMFPSNFTTETLVPFIYQAPTQNPLTFIPLSVSAIGAGVCFCLGIVSFLNTERKTIIRTAATSLALLILIAISLASAEKVYTDMVPGYLNKPITLQINQTGQDISLTGKLSDVGIKFATGEGIYYVVTVLILSVFALGAAIRWIFEGNVPVDDSSDSRIQRI